MYHLNRYITQTKLKKASPVLNFQAFQRNDQSPSWINKFYKEWHQHHPIPPIDYHGSFIHGRSSLLEGTLKRWLPTSSSNQREDRWCTTRAYQFSYFGWNDTIPTRNFLQIVRSPPHEREAFQKKERKIKHIFNDRTRKRINTKEIPQQNEKLACNSLYDCRRQHFSLKFNIKMNNKLSLKYRK